jgi:hypothetical protein
VLGYRDTSAIFLAMERGEVMGRTVALSAIRATRPDWLKPGSDFHLLVAFARRTRLPDFPDVPTARELAPNEAARALIEFTETPLMTMARPFAAPPGIPAERAAVLRTAFMAAHRDPQYIADAATVGIEISPVSADELMASLDEMAQASPEIFAYVRKLYAANKGD